MTRKFIPVAESFHIWEQDPAFRDAYDALEEEFFLAAALIETRMQVESKLIRR